LSTCVLPGAVAVERNKAAVVVLAVLELVLD
jgi:hypothetical protein